MRRIALSVLVLAALLVPTSTAQASNGVDDLRGRWDVQWQMESEGPGWLSELTVNITDLETSKNDPNVYLATGCMAVADIGYFAPLSLQATDNLDGTYDVVFLSTVVPGVNGSGPFIVRFNGLLEVHGNGVTDDLIGGELQTGYGGGNWTGEHHDRRRVKCPAADASELYFGPDLYIHRDLSAYPEPDQRLYEGYTNIVSSAMLVEKPDGSEIIITEYTDIFSPQVDFVDEFRYLVQEIGYPAPGEPYFFTLLDILGNPIPGTRTADYWMGCNQGAPTDLAASYQSEQHVNLSWTAVNDVPGEFEPQATPQIGDYLLSLSPLQFQANVTEYGMHLGRSNYHVIPWDPFVVDEIEDDPDGYDRGVSLSQLSDGLYQVTVQAFGQSHPDDPGFGLECATHSSSDSLQMVKDGANLSFYSPGNITGTVTSTSGEPIEGIQVDACEYDNNVEPFCSSGTTNSSGQYMINGLVPDDYRVGIFNQPGWAGEFYNDTTIYGDAARITVLSGQETPNIDFGLEQGGSISGTVYDADGNPLAGIGVDTEEGGYGTCTDEVGFYSLEGVPFGTYNVVAGRDICEPHPYAEQTIEAVEVGSEGVDFYLSEGFSISGTVFDIEGNPLPDIAVDTEEGGFGTCTDENGFYSLDGLTAGTYNVAAGRDFCAEHPYAEQLQESIPAGSEGVDFYLEPFTEPFLGYLNVQPEHGWAESGGWAVGANVTLSYNAFSTDQTAVPADWDPEIGVVLFEGLSGLDVGTLVTATDGENTKVLEVVAVSFDFANVDTNAVGGNAPAGTPLYVGLVDLDDNFFDAYDFQADGANSWSTFLGDFSQVADAWVQAFDGDGDSTIAHLYLEPAPEPSSAYLNVEPVHGWAESGGWVPGSTITLTFGSYSVVEGDTDNDGYVFFDLSGSGIAPGAEVTVSDGVQSKVLVVSEASFDAIDEVENTAQGTGPANADIHVAVFDINGDSFGYGGIQIDGSGNWFVDLDDVGGDFSEVTNALVQVFDEDGDSTIAHLDLSAP